MAIVYATQGKYDMALEWYQRALAGFEKNLGTDHPDTQIVINRLEIFYRQRGMYEEAAQHRSRYSTP